VGVKVGEVCGRFVSCHRFSRFVLDRVGVANFLESGRGKLFWSGRGKFFLESGRGNLFLSGRGKFIFRWAWQTFFCWAWQTFF